VAPWGSAVRRIAIVLWSGEYGGAETWSLALANSLLHQGCCVGVVLVSGPGPLCEKLLHVKIPYRCLGLNRGSAVLGYFRGFSSLVREMGADAAILPSGGYMSAALRLGGYAGTIVAVEHGSLLQLPRMGRSRRMLRVVDALSGAWAVDAQVVPSDYVLREIRRYSYGQRARRIYLGTDCGIELRELPGQATSSCGELTLGFAGRLVRGKGLDVLLDALCRARTPFGIRLDVAGDGPERSAMESRAAELGIGDRVRFRGWVSNIRDFWSACHVAVVPSRECESFGMVAVEAMAAGLPVIAARNGGLAEVVSDGETGALFEPGDADELSRLIDEYASNPQLRHRQGNLARARVRSQFDIDRCAAEFLDLIQQVRRSRSSGAAFVGGT
jgi:glycosyltransferase involved in cell wall biosynthesis